MATYNDSFTDTNGTNLESHTPTSGGGGTWSLADGTAGSFAINASNQVKCVTAGASYYFPLAAGDTVNSVGYTVAHSGTNAEYNYKAVIHLTDHLNWGGGLRDYNGSFQLYTMTGGSRSTLQTGGTAGTGNVMLLADDGSGNLTVTQDGSPLLSGTGINLTETNCGMVTSVAYDPVADDFVVNYTASGGGTTVTGDLGISSTSSVTFNGISSGQSLGISSALSVAFVGQQTNQSDVSISSISAVNWNTSTGESNLTISAASANNWVGTSSLLGNELGIASVSTLNFVGSEIQTSDLSISSTSTVYFIGNQYVVSDWQIQVVSALGWVAASPTTVTADWLVSSVSTLSFISTTIVQSAIGITSTSSLTWGGPVLASQDLNGWKPALIRKREQERIALIKQEDDEIMAVIQAALPYLEQQQ